MKIGPQSNNAYVQASKNPAAERASSTSPTSKPGVEHPGGAGDSPPKNDMLDLPTQSREERNASHGVGGGGSTGSPATSERAKPSDPNQRSTGDSDGEKFGLDAFSREKQLMDLVDPWQALIGGHESTPGGKSFADLEGGVGTPNNGDGKNGVSRRGQLSDGDPATTPSVYTSRTESTAEDRWNQQSINPANKDKSQSERDQKREDAPPERNQSFEPRAAAPVERTWSVGRIFGEIEKFFSDGKQKQTYPVGVRGTPNPETDAGDPAHLPIALTDAMRSTPKTKAEADEERRRQNTLPGEATRARLRGTLDPAEVYAGMIDRNTDGLIRPANDEDGADAGPGSRNPGYQGGGNPKPVDPSEGFGIDTPQSGNQGGSGGSNPGDPDDD